MWIVAMGNLTINKEKGARNAFENKISISVLDSRKTVNNAMLY